MKERLKTAEIKIFLRECVQDGNCHTIDDFKKHIADNSGKSFTIGQLSGAISQLTALGELEKVERGLYRNGMGTGIISGRETVTVNRENEAANGCEMMQEKEFGQIRKVNGENIADKIGETEENKQIKEMWDALRTFLEEADRSLADIVGRANVWNLSGAEFELLREVKRLGEQMKAIASKC